ncbi:hypothetical protein JDV02_008857 [Purpureocillium takamizusanense]|uniref:Uncharacterized protein n=1 Tax=Purpureocillium takamizusanense TaxID=2060973 RepID=A0A9Q8VF48_9HYPO|nr:uncharacterized protein JDV02_008857 [Purpureocillium takamizusanense]UNI23016.1 hypothetical protein JDV02_008857 [Purpureocillium takamizusanense]
MERRRIHVFRWDTDMELIIMGNKTCFIVRSTEAYLADSPQLQERYLFLLEVARNFELDGHTVEDLYDWAVEPVLPVFRIIQPPMGEEPSFLHEYLFPTTLAYTLRADSGRLTAVPDEREIRSRFGVVLPVDSFSTWPCFHPREIQLVPPCSPAIGPPPSQTPNKVLMSDGTVAFLKLIHQGEKSILKRELETYAKSKPVPSATRCPSRVSKD